MDLVKIVYAETKAQAVWDLNSYYQFTSMSLKMLFCTRTSTEQHHKLSQKGALFDGKTPNCLLFNLGALKDSQGQTASFFCSHYQSYD